MKKIISIALCAIMCAGIFCGCAKKEQIAINTEADLNGKKLGVQSSTTGETWCTENCKDAKISAFKSGMDAAIDLKNGAIDAVVLDELPAKAIIKENPELKIVDSIHLESEAYAIAVKKGNTELLDSINKTIADSKTSGLFDKLVASYMPADGEPKVYEAIPAGGDKVIKLGTNAAFKPFEYVEGAKPVGFDISMGEQIAADFGATLQVEDMDFNALISALNAGSIDFIAAGMSITEERQKSVDFSDEYYKSSQVVIVRK